MFLRLMNRLDFECMADTIKNEIDGKAAQETVSGRIKELVDILDENYSTDRKSFSMGGFVFLITSLEERNRACQKIIDCYKIADRLEYSDVICEDEASVWQEELYLRGDDDSIVIIYPQPIDICTN